MAGVDSDSLIVAAIVFGTTYSGVYFSRKRYFEDNPRRFTALPLFGRHMLTLKGPTSVLITGDGGEVDSFGNDAEAKYAKFDDEERHTKWYFFRRFNMRLHGEKTIKHEVMLEDVTGKKMSALEVFSLSLKYLKDFVMEAVHIKKWTPDDFHWVLTVPASWTDTAKQFMQKAAKMAGIDGNRLTIVLEPDAASLYVRHISFEKGSISPFKNGTKYLMLDADGDRLNITLYEITLKGHIKELHHVTGGACGGTKVDEAFEGFLQELFGDFPYFKRYHVEDYHELFLNFEVEKRHLPSSGKVIIKIPSSLDTNLKTTIACSRYSERIDAVANRLRIDVDIIKDLLIPTVNNIVCRVKYLLRNPALRGCSTIFMVGGFSECQVLQNKVREAFPTMTVIIPKNAGLAVLKGAFMFGQKPAALTEYHPSCKTYMHENGDECYDDGLRVDVKKEPRINDIPTRSTGLPSDWFTGKSWIDEIVESLYNPQSELVKHKWSSEDNKVREAFPTMKEIIPEETGLAVLKGAVMSGGHKPTALTENHPSCKTYMDENGDECLDDGLRVDVKKEHRINDIPTRSTELPSDWPNDQAMNEKIVVRLCSPQSELVKHKWSSEDVYSMKKRIRGRCIVISNKIFYNLQTRTGTEQDEIALKKLFTQLMFEVEIHKNKSAADMLTILTTEAGDQSHAQADCFVCVICSHGGAKGICGVDGNVVGIEKITTRFDGKNCPALANKPKLFFIQACQGGQRDTGVMVDGQDLWESVLNMELESDSMAPAQPRYIPTKLDILVACATHPGHVSIRHGSNGSWFIETLVYVFKRYACEKDILHLLTLVNRLVAKRKAHLPGSEKHTVQAANFQSYMVKEFFFFPGIADNP